jgi:type I restriction enzyme M protein
MLNANVKQQINTARDILVGKIPDPKGQIDQITNALIYKFMDDQDRLALTLPGGKANFFVNELKPYAWHKLFDSKLSNQDKANLYVEGIAKLSVSKHLPDLFRDIFKDAFLPFRAPDTIAMFLGEINKFDYHHSEDLGNAFEYLLSIMGSQGDAGQFRTPRNVIEFIVDAVDPSKDDYILDPACGTAGFLVEAYNHITKDKKLTPNEIQELAQHIHGVDIDPGMAKIARVNLYLHGFKTPLITEDDTLSDERLWGKKYDVILANPPFMTPKGGIVPHDKFSVKSNRAEVLFTDYIAEHLKLAGRAGVVVPEGIIFQSGKVYKQLRKMLVDDNYLWAVVSLPAGVFNPYSGVKTSILLFDRERSAKNTEILFFKVNNDGFDLGAQRREISKNDLPEALGILKKWKNNEKVENSKAIYIKKEKIAETGDYKLSIDRYRVATDYTNAKWPMVKLGEIVVDMKDGGTPSRSKPEYFGGKVNWAVVKDIVPEIYDTKEKLTESGLKNSSAKVWPIDSVIISLGATIGNVGIAKVPVATKQGLSGIVVDKERILPKFLYYILIGQKEFIQSQATGASIKEVRPSKLQEILKIPLPPLEIQEQIVAELEGYAGIIAGAKQITQNWKPKIDIDPEWEKVKLGEVADVTAGQSPDGKYYNDKGDGTPFYQGKTEFGNIYLGEPKKWTTQITKIADVGDILMSVRAPVGPANITQNKICIGRGLAGIRVQKIEQMFLFTYLQMIENQIIGNGGAVFDSITKKQIEEIKIPFPPLEIQKQIVEKIEFERSKIEGAKELIPIYREHIKNTIAKLWKE